MRVKTGEHGEEDPEEGIREISVHSAPGAVFVFAAAQKNEGSDLLVSVPEGLHFRRSPFPEAGHASAADGTPLLGYIVILVDHFDFHGVVQG